MVKMTGAKWLHYHIVNITALVISISWMGEYQHGTMQVADFMSMLIGVYIGFYLLLLVLATIMTISFSTYYGPVEKAIDMVCDPLIEPLKRLEKKHIDPFLEKNFPTYYRRLIQRRAQKAAKLNQ